MPSGGAKPVGFPPRRRSDRPRALAGFTRPPWSVADTTDPCFIVLGDGNGQAQGACLRLLRGRQCCTVEESMRKALLFVIVVAMAATGLWLFVAGLFFESETNIWYVVSGGSLIGLGGDRLWRDFVAPFLGFQEG
jgi:hypothetical protein